ncbi:hypothetical protein GCK32_019253 [Trichostrongylus colubriformis]|uniref:Uncharacterized protein n=1 Tax=Trichostrongylus colubriformis TaxID=6319 RepID=A0AAN8F6T8_TRICO
MATATINLQSDLSQLHEITPQILRTLSKIGPQNISEVKFTVGKSTQGCYLRLDFLPFPESAVEMPMVTKYADVGVTCCGDFPAPSGNLTTHGIDYDGNENKCDISIQTGQPLSKNE